MPVEYRMLGPLEALVDGEPLRLGGPRHRATLAILLAHARETVASSHLIDELWGEEPPQTARNLLQGVVSDLRKVLGREEIVTRGNGYGVALAAGALDLDRFERLAADGTEALADGDGTLAAKKLTTALALSRGPALADLAGEPAVRAIAARLDEIRLNALERRIDADLLCARHREVVGELRELVLRQPLRERLCAQLMLALYRCGRQAEALEAYRAGRRTLIEQLGIEPGRQLQELERAVLRQDPALDAPEARTAAPVSGSGGTILVLSLDRSRMDALLSIAEPLARRPARALILVRVLREGEGLASEMAALSERRGQLGGRGVEARVAAFTSPTPAGEAALLATEHDVDLVLVDAPDDMTVIGAPLAGILDSAPCDVGVLVSETSAPLGSSGPVATPFGGGENDWSAIELAAWIARALGRTLRLVGTEAEPGRGRRDASRLLARASLLVQEVVGIVTEPRLVPTGSDGMLSAVQDASLLVLGFSDRWRAEGLGAARLAVVRGGGVPALLVRRGVRPGGIAPTKSATRFTWSLADG